MNQPQDNGVIRTDKESNTEKTHTDETSNNDKIRTDRAPIEKRLPDFPETEKIFWTQKRLGESTVGPTSLQLDIWALLKEDTFEEFIKDAPSIPEDGLQPEFIPNEFEQSYSWEKMDDQYIFDSEKLGKTQFNPTIYFDKEKQMVYIVAVGEG